VVYVRHDESRATIIQIVIENIGRGLASDVTFTTSRPLPFHAFGLDEKTAEEAKSMTEGPFVDGIPTLGPGDSRKITWGQYGGLKRALGDQLVIVTCRFRHGRRRMKPTISKLEVRSFAITDATSSEGARVIRALESIDKQVEKVSRVLEQSQRSR
jgi:hypothetical protein